MEDYKICGLVAVISPKVQTASENKIFKDMLVLDQLRGKDSTGMFSVDKTGVSIAKSVATPTDFLQLSRVTSAIAGASILVGHNRHATMGAVNANNAHPFQHDNITLVHNGTLDRAYKLPQFDTDSESVCYQLAQCESWSDTTKYLESIDGAFAFIWYDDVDEALYFIRNEERPLYCVMVQDTMYLASERGFLFAALERNNVSIKDLSVFTEVPVDTLHCVTVKNNKLEVNTEVLKLKKFYSQSYLWGGGLGQRSNGVSTTTNTSSRWQDDLYLELGLHSGDVVRGSVERIEPYAGGVQGTVHVRMNERGLDSKVIVFGQTITSLSPGMQVQVRVSRIDMNMPSNVNSPNTYGLTCHGTGVVPYVEEDLGGEEDILDSMVVCGSCDLPCAVEAATKLIDDSYVCDSCIATDPVIQMYVQGKIA